MSREIRFRAWDKERKEMLPVTSMNWSEWWLSCEPVLEGTVHPLDYGERNSFRNEQTNRHILMQYTGLKDRNGKEIFEGDVLRTFSGDFVVTWDQYRFVLPEFYCSGNDNPGDYFSERGEDEVIGNVWENPELLGGGEDAKE